MGSLTCPYCSAVANFTQRYLWDEPIPGANTVRFGVWTCDNCHKPMVGEPDGLGTPTKYHPRNVVTSDLTDIPDAIAMDVAEAHRCQSAECSRAAAAMARRALQAAAYDKGAPDGKLIDQIDWLAEQGEITKQMKDVAHHIRLSGNLGAHPDRDGLKDIAETDAAAILGFLDDFMRYVYKIPASLGRLQTENP